MCKTERFEYLFENDDDEIGYLIPVNESLALLCEKDFLLDKEMADLYQYDDDEDDEDGYFL